MIKFAKLRKLTNNRMTSKAREQQKKNFMFIIISQIKTKILI